ncbi:MAG: calcium-translocating P-type ATPase, PMCA-type, partial [Oscillospiraceae bacterium]|nr:calcium-translocating P-type ATPase, PMCA-type [Oscillospiraceae bacterium]
MFSFHSLSAQETLVGLKTHPRRGLSASDAAHRLDTYGPNQLKGKPPRPLLLRLWDQLRDPMILVLLGAAALSLWSSGGEDWLDSVIILFIVVVNAAISISQENSAQKALEALQNMSAPRARVIREGREQSIPAKEVVPGDIILLEAGDLVPADARLIEAHSLKADESAMTGESVPVDKSAGGPLPQDTPLADRHNMVIGSTVITAGRAIAVATATGMASEVGKVANLLLDQEEAETPLQHRMGEISKILSFVCLCVCAVMFGVGLLEGRELLGMFMTAVSLAVAAIPEGLPAIVTIVLALGVQRMAKEGAIVKKLPAVETLGCAGVICSDKTGTLTQNKMTVRRTWTPAEVDRRTLLTTAALCCDAIARGDSFFGDPTEVAIVEAAHREGVRKSDLDRDFPRKAELPFDSERKLMTTVHPDRSGGFRVCVKGAPDVLLSRCTLSDSQKKAALAANDDLARSALRVLGVACKTISALPASPNSDALESGLTFLGLVGMIDPPREEVKAAVDRCRQAGIRPVMITGDHKLTAVAIAKELGIYAEGDLAITGSELDFMPQEMLETDIEKFSVFARVSPEHKTRIVNAWRKRGQVVAMTGDGVNDAPALRSAHIGCAMGKAGTDVAKGAADMILTDDNFATIVSAVAQGRGIYANIRKAVHYLLSCNIGEIITIFIATVLGFHQMPLLPVQLLWLNLVTDSLPALALGVEPVEAGIMEEKPRPAGESLFTRRFSLRLLWQGIMVGLLTLTAYALGEYVLSDPGEAYQAANTMAFATLTLCQLFHAFDVRSESHSLLSIGVFSNPTMNKAFLVGAVLQISVLTLPPLQRIFQPVPLNPMEWAVVLL